MNNLNSALAGPDVDKLAAAQANEKLAEATLASAQAHAAKVGRGWTRQYGRRGRRGWRRRRLISRQPRRQSTRPMPSWMRSICN